MFEVYDEETVAAVEVYGDGTFGVKEDSVVFGQWNERVLFDFGGDLNDAAGDCGDLDIVGQADAAFGFLFVLVFTNEDAFADWLDGFEGIFDLR